MPADPLEALAANAVKNALSEIRDRVEAVVPADRSARLTDKFFGRIEYLEADLPPLLPEETHNAFAEIMSAAWIHALIFGQVKESQCKTLRDGAAAYQKSCRLTLKAIELHSSGQATSPVNVAREEERNKGVLSANQITWRAGQPLNSDKRLGIVPFDQALVQGASLDVRLGSWFKTARKTRIGNIDLTDPKARSWLAAEGWEERHVPLDGEFHIHPGDFVLGATIEFVALPADLMAFVEGKSSIGRTGLLVATATQVGPGFHGVVVLELANAGTVPLIVHPGMSIAQLVFQSLDSAATDHAYSGGFSCQIRP
jgi:dCTP deaminase